MAGVVENFKRERDAHGLLGAMRWLNHRVPYRFTAIFAFDGDLLRNVCLVDKENLDTTNCADQPITESYCIYIHRSRQPFAIFEAALDARVRGHPKRSNFQCYYGIPLFGAKGKLLGTMCHFDEAPIRVTEEVVSALDDLATLIAQAAFKTE